MQTAGIIPKSVERPFTASLDIGPPGRRKIWNTKLGECVLDSGRGSAEIVGNFAKGLVRE
jgi:hypothetical protein